ncbi:protein translocase subunit SecD [Streptacidiphilus sp. PB12-B1b]|nr:protein translocase subunit SecD [Streptacidiphilus sp. PB12-B1b]QMU80212.1 protein translocase subunit SecD [Streptacidiphilus sp. PB12-B1b]
MFATGYKTPHLGIDLAGGSSVTLKASPTAGKPASSVNPTSMNQAVGILTARVNGLGVSDATVQTEGNDTIVVTVPKSQKNNQEVLNDIGNTALLYFRPVIAYAFSGNLPTPPASPSPSASAGAKTTPSPSASVTTKLKAAGGTPSPSASKAQGDALSQALTKPATPSSSAGAKAASTAKATATPKPTASAPAAPVNTATQGLQGTVPAALTSRFDSIDCSKAGQRQDYQGAPTSDAVACAQDKDPTTGLYIKYALGPVAVAGTEVSSAAANVSTSGGWEIDLSFNSKGTSQFAKTTTSLVSAPAPTNGFAIVLDGLVQSAPTVNQAITGGQAQITGSFTQQQAQALANSLNYGALPLKFKQLDVTTVSPQLGSSQLTAGLVSGAIGLALVILYSLVYYRGLGLVAIGGLGLSAVLTYSIMSLLGGTIHFALNLPAVCGAIVAIGITADSFVVYFERIRDEVRKGSSLRPAVQRAWPRARRTILVSDFVSFLAAAVLYFFTVGTVQGFAFTLGLTTLLDVVVIFLFTKPLITLLARRKFFAEGRPMSGLDPKRLGARPPIRGGRRRPAETKEA